MPSLSKKYKINYNKRYTISKNKKQQGHKSIKVYNRVKRLSRKRKDYVGGDIEVPAINNIFPSGQTYQPNPDCLEKECDKDDAGKKTTTCLNTQIVMNLFRQTLDDSEQETMDRIDGNFTDEERKHVQDLTEKYLTNYVGSLFSKSIFSKNNAELKPENIQKLKDLLEVIKPKYVDYLTRDSNLSDDIKQQILATQEELNVVDNVVTPAPIDNTNAPATTALTSNAPTSTNASAIVDNTAVIEAERAKKAAEDAEAERLRLIAEAAQAKQAALNEAKQINQTRIDATNKANETYADAVKQANQIRIEAVEKANQELDTNVKNGMSKTRYNFKHNRALELAENAEKKAIKIAERVKNKAINNATIAGNNSIDAINRKISARKNLVASKPANNP